MDTKTIHVRGERSTGAKWKKRKEMCCNFCAQRGHFARNCPDITCWECGKKGHEKKSCFVKFFRLFTIWNKRMNWWSMMWMKNWKNVLEKRKCKNESEKEVKKEGIGKINEINEIKKEKIEINNKDVHVIKKKEIKNEDIKNNAVKVGKNKIENEKKDFNLINNNCHQKELIKIDDSNINQKNININNNKISNEKNNKKNNSKNEKLINMENNYVMRSKVKMLKRRIKKIGYEGDISFHYKENNILNINELYDLGANDEIFMLKKINIFNYCDCESLDFELLFGKKIKINANKKNYEKYIIGVINELIILKNEDKINIILHIIDKKLNVYISYKFKSPLCTVQEKNVWLCYDTKSKRWMYIKKCTITDVDKFRNEIAFIN